MHCDNFTYIPQFKLWLLGNHQPNLHNVDAAMRRRLYMLPFILTPKEPDKFLENKLKEEAAGILRWMIDGCLSWQKSGLIPSATVSAATSEYFDSQDTKTLWLNECCDVEPRNRDKTATSTELFKSWSEFAKTIGEPNGSQKALARWLDRKFTRDRVTGGTRIYRGLRVRLLTKNTDGSEAY
jgi:putative DNA primase/helicase